MPSKKKKSVKKKGQTPGKKKAVQSKKKGVKKRLPSKKKTSKVPVVEEELPVSLVDDTISTDENSDLETGNHDLVSGDESFHEKYMTIGEHLEELRQVFIRGLIAIGIFMILGMAFGEEVHKILTTPYKKVLGENATFYQIKLLAPFMIYLKSSFMLALLLSFPLQLYFLWGFVAPALDRNTARYGKYIILFSTLLFWIGVGLCWYGVYEKMLHFFLITFQPPDIETKLPIDEYFDIFFNLHLLFGITFQLPVVLILLGRFGVVKSSFLYSKWREVTISLAIASAFFSPPDIISLLLLFIPLEFLFFISLIIMRITEKKDQ